MTISRIQSTHIHYAVAATSASITLGAAPTDGNALILTNGGNGDTATSGGDISSITQTGATWVKAVAVNFDDATRISNAEIWYALNVSGAATGITVNFSSGGEGGALCVAEYSGLATSSALDKTATNHATSGTSTDTGTTATTSQANQLWVGSLGNPQISPHSYSAPTNGFTIVAQDDVNFGMGAFLEKIVSSTGTANTSATQSAGFEWAGCIATFNAASGTPQLIAQIVCRGQVGPQITIADFVTHGIFGTSGNVYNESITESVTVADVLSALLTANTSISASTALTDVLAAIATFNASISASTVVTDSLTPALIIGKSISESILATDSLNISVTFSAVLSASIAATDSLQTHMTANTSLSVSTALTDAISPNLVISKLISESIAASDTLSIIATFRASISAIMALTDALQATLLISVSVLESIVATDSLLAGLILNEEISEILILDDELVAGLVFNETLSEAISLSDFVIEILEPSGDGIKLRLRHRNTLLEPDHRNSTIECRQENTGLQPDARNVILSPKSRKNLI